MGHRLVYCICLAYLQTYTNHKLVSYHSGIISQWDPASVPFILSHGSGMLLAEFHHIIRLVENGCAFAAVEKCLGGGFLHTFHRMSRKFKPSETAWKTHLKILSPGTDLIRKCYVVHC